MAQVEEGPHLATIGQYQICQLLGTGAQASVYQGLDTVTGRKVALKICSNRLPERQLARLQAECSVMSDLSHKHIIKFHGVFESQSRLGLVMDLAEGGDLYHHIKSHGCLSPRETHRIFRQIVSALNHMHSLGTFRCRQRVLMKTNKINKMQICNVTPGYMHRDLKPENCLLDKDKNVLLGDFGFSNFWWSYKQQREGDLPALFPPNRQRSALTAVFIEQRWGL